MHEGGADTLPQAPLLLEPPILTKSPIAALTPRLEDKSSNRHAAILTHQATRGEPVRLRGIHRGTLGPREAAFLERFLPAAATDHGDDERPTAAAFHSAAFWMASAASPMATDMGRAWEKHKRDGRMVLQLRGLGLRIRENRIAAAWPMRIGVVGDPDEDARKKFWCTVATRRTGFAARLGGDAASRRLIARHLSCRLAMALVLWAVRRVGPRPAKLGRQQLSPCSNHGGIT